MSSEEIPFSNAKHQAVQLPPDHPLRRDQPINWPVYDQDNQWRLKIQRFSEGGFEAKAVLVNRNRLNSLLRHNEQNPRKPRSKEPDAKLSPENLQKAAFRAARRVRLLCLEIKADRLLTLTSRGLLRDLDQVALAWKRFMRVLERTESKFLYVAVPELHKSGEHYHIHVAISGYVRADLLRRCWQIALGGKGTERGYEALGNVDIKQRKGKYHDPVLRCVGIAKYLSKYITKSYTEQQNFNRKRYWAPRSVKLPQTEGEWLRAESTAEALLELYERFGEGLISHLVSQNALHLFNMNGEIGKNPMIFLRWMPGMKQLDAPF